LSFNPNIPIITDPILQSAAQIKANFQAINQTFSGNHVGLTTDQEFSGMHSVLTLRPQASDPTTSSTETALYNKLVSSIPALFYRPNSNQTPIQLTYPSLQTSTFPIQTFCAGPFIIYAGFIPQPTQGQIVNLTPGTSLIFVDLTVAFLNFPTLFAFPAIAAPTNVIATSFNISYPSALLFSPGSGVYFFAIGI